MAIKYVNIAEFQFSSNPEDVLVAPNLGSCLGVAVYDPQRRVGGLIHCLLPLSKSDPEKAAAKPCMYVDSGVLLLLETLIRGGSDRDALLIAVAGGAQINDTNGVFEIGKKNITVLRKILWKNNLLIKAQDVGGDHSRTVSLHIGTGEVSLKSQGLLRRLM